MAEIYALLIIVNTQLAVTGMMFESQAVCDGIREAFNAEDDAPGLFMCAPVIGEVTLYTKSK